MCDLFHYCSGCSNSFLYLIVAGNTGLGESCSSPSDCAVDNTICTGSPSVCQCITGYFDSNGAAVKKGVCLKSMYRFHSQEICILLCPL